MREVEPLAGGAARGRDVGVAVEGVRVGGWGVLLELLGLEAMKQGLLVFFHFIACISADILNVSFFPLDP